MKLNLFLRVVFLYFTRVGQTAVPHNYFLIKKYATWTEAQNYCRQNYEDLATVESPEDWERLAREAASNGVTSLVWLGLYDDIQSWRWTFNNLSVKATGFTNWSPGEPNNSNGCEWCAGIDPSGYWLDLPCTISMNFTCYNANYSGSESYVGVTTKQTFAAARAYCQQHHTDLARATNSTENGYIQQVAMILGRSFIGLYRDNWMWSDGTNVSNLPWYPGTPHNVNGSEDCGMLYNGLLTDEQCNNKHYFFCHTVPTIREQQTVRVQLKADDTMLDPAVQSIMLEQIKQKLAEQIMLQNITITWKKNRNGSVFNKKSSNDDNL